VAGSAKSLESTTHLLFIAEATLLSDGGDAVVGLLKLSPRCINADCFDGSCWSAAALFRIYSRKIPSAHVHPIRERFDP
jgi:hypothetical protein